MEKYTKDYNCQYKTFLCPLIPGKKKKNNDDNGRLKINRSSSYKGAIFQVTFGLLLLNIRECIATPGVGKNISYK